MQFLVTNFPTWELNHTVLAYDYALDAAGDVELPRLRSERSRRARARHLRPDRAPLRGERASTTPSRGPSAPSACTTGRCSRPAWRASPRAPDWYSHGLNRVAYYRLATAAAAGAAAPRAPPASRAAWAGCSRAPCPRSAARCGATSARVLAGAPPARARRAGARDLRQLRRVLRGSAHAQSRGPAPISATTWPPREGEHHLDAAIAAGRGRRPAHRAPRQLGARGAAPRPPGAAAPPTWCSPPSRTRRSSATCGSTARGSAS